MLVVLLMLFLAIPAFAQESILLNVNQTHSLQWDWQQGEEGPVRSFVFQCQQYRKDLEADARSLRFGNLIDQPGRYTGCTLSAKNEAGLSSPVIVPDFEYAYAYPPIGMLLLELLTSLGVLSSSLIFIGRRLFLRRQMRSRSPQVLPEPSMVLTKERDYVVHHS